MATPADKPTTEKPSTAKATKKKWLLKRLMSKHAWNWRFLNSGFRWKRPNLHISFFDDVLFKIVSVFEAIILVTTLSFFYCLCGCHF